MMCINTYEIWMNNDKFEWGAEPCFRGLFFCLFVFEDFLRNNDITHSAVIFSIVKLEMDGTFLFTLSGTIYSITEMIF